MAITLFKTTTYNEFVIDIRVEINSGTRLLGNPPTSIYTHTITVKINDQYFFTKSGYTDRELLDLVTLKEDEAKRYIDNEIPSRQPVVTPLQNLGFTLVE